MESKVVHLTREEITEDIGQEQEPEAPKKVYYEYVTDKVEQNLPAERVAETMQWLRTQYEQAQAREPLIWFSKMNHVINWHLVE